VKLYSLVYLMGLTVSSPSETTLEYIFHKHAPIEELVGAFFMPCYRGYEKQNPLAATSGSARGVMQNVYRMTTL